MRRRLIDVGEMAYVALDGRRHHPRYPEIPEPYERIYCYHIRKTAGTSLHRSFLSLAPEAPEAVEARIAQSYWRRATSGGKTYVGGNRHVINGGRYFYGWSHYPSHQLTLPAGTYTITVLRDPVDRVLSYFSYLAEGDRPGMALRVDDRERRLADGGFASFLERVPKADLLCQLYMFASDFDVDRAVDAAARCTLLLRSESFDEGIRILSRDLHLPLPLRHDRGTRARFVPSEAEREQLMSRLEPEYHMLDQLRPRLAVPSS
jgi:hypothetical protein